VIGELRAAHPRLFDADGERFAKGSLVREAAA
jgi:hypothetical protein